MSTSVKYKDSSYFTCANEESRISQNCSSLIENVPLTPTLAQNPPLCTQKHPDLTDQLYDGFFCSVRDRRG